MLPTKFRVSWPFGSGEEGEIDFQNCCHGSHLRFLTGTILAIFYIQVTSMLPTKFRVNWPFALDEEAKTRFSRWQP